MARLEPGDTAPDFTLLDQDGKPVRLADFAGRRVLLYFYPKDATPGCTIEANDFQALAEDFARAGITVVGISPDSPESHVRFRRDESLEFTLLSDPDHVAMAAYGAWGDKMNYGRTIQGVIRSTVLVGPDGVVEHSWYNVRAKGHAARVLEVA